MLGRKSTQKLEPVRAWVEATKVFIEIWTKLTLTRILLHDSAMAAIRSAKELTPPMDPSRLTRYLASHRGADTIGAAWTFAKELSLQLEALAPPERIKKKAKGRPRGTLRSDSETDTRIYRDWKASGMYKDEFAKEKGLAFVEVDAAIKRYRVRTKNGN